MVSRNSHSNRQGEQQAAGTLPPSRILQGAWKLALCVAFGSGIGGTSRVAAAEFLPFLFQAHFPFGVLAINTVGSFAIGFLAALPLSAPVRHFLLAGLCGGFTTFGFYSLQNMQMLQAGRLAAAASYTGLTILLPMLAVGTGYRTGLCRLFWRKAPAASPPEGTNVDGKQR